MSRHTHDQLEDALDLRILIDDEEKLFIYPPILITFLLYRAIRNNGVDTKLVLKVLCAEPAHLIKFLEICGDDDIETVMKFSDSSKMHGVPVLGADIMKAWAARQTILKMARK